MIEMAGIVEFVESLRSAGFGLVFLWLLTLSIVYGILSHIGGGLPRSVSARGIISISISFLVLLAASGPATAAFLSNLTSSLVIIAFGILITMIFLEMAGVKVGEKGLHIFHQHGTVFGIALIVLIILVFIGAGGLKLVGLPTINITGEIAALALFIIVMVAAIYLLYTETTKNK